MAKKSKGQNKMEKTMHEFKEGTLHSGSKKGPKVTSRDQAIAIGLSQARAAGAKIPKKGGNTDLPADSMKAKMCSDREDNLTAKKEFLKRNTNRKSF